MNELNQLTDRVIGACIKIHKNLGPGLLESTYQECLAYELTQAEIPFEKEKKLPIQYDNIFIEDAYRVDFIVNNSIIIELKSVEQLNSTHEAQTLTYLKLSKLPLALLINFKTKLLKDGIRRYAH
ncbi:MAG TPA: GxxExxY protein [Alphaproteobacteria bacterium]|nr:GxxExxY protein [Alphaproteobacteria bacterium]